MTETRSTYFGYPRYSEGTDEAVTRSDWEEMVTRTEERVAYDDGVSVETLPATLLKPGRYVRQSFADGYALHRRSDAAWEWQGGTVQPVRVRMRSTTAADVMLSSDTGGVTPTTTATWKASGEIATAAALRSSSVGAFGAALDADLSVPGTTGRAYVRTVANGDRALVLAAHDDAAGALLTARVAGGSDPTVIDSRGRLRSAAPAGLGQSSPATNIPLGISPAASDVTALDLYARPELTPVPALRAFRTAGDSDAIMRVLPDLIALGRSSWAGASITLRAPTVGLIGSVAVTGTLGVSEPVTLAKGITAEGAKLASYSSGSQAGMRSAVALFGEGNVQTRDMRQMPIHRRRQVNLDVTVTNTSEHSIHKFSFVPTTTCNIDISLVTYWRALGPGSSGGQVEPVGVAFRIRVLAQDDSVLYSGDAIDELTLNAYDTFNVAGRSQIVVEDSPNIQLNAGSTYQIEIYGRRSTESAISSVLRHIRGTLREGALVSV